MQKGEKTIFSKIVVIAIIMLILNFANFSSKYKSSGITGNSIKDTTSNFYSAIPDSSKLFLLLQWLCIISVMIYFSIKDKIEIDSKKGTALINVDKDSENSKTDLDSLYCLLKDKRELEINLISKSFNISKELAMDWCKVLETGNLAAVSYNRMGEPVIKLIDK